MIPFPVWFGLKVVLPWGLYFCIGAFIGKVLYDKSNYHDDEELFIIICTFLWIFMIPVVIGYKLAEKVRG